ncbi:MAG: TPM domain-containing protein [Candidatus Cryptobacteroides sp.]
MESGKRVLIYFASVLISAAVAIASVADVFAAVPERPVPQRLVNDLAGLFTQFQADSLESVLVAFDDSTSTQIAVVTVSDLDGYDPAEMAQEIGQAWGVGQKGKENGIVILVKPKTADSAGKVSIQVGYGLEEHIPDVYCSRIINQTMIPRFKEGDYFRAVAEGADILMKLATGKYKPEEDDLTELKDFAEAMLWLFIVIFMIVIAVRLNHKDNSKGNGGSGGRKTYPDIYIGPIGGWGLSGSFGDLGSFGGFGGFGGGSFGGGGASGSW